MRRAPPYSSDEERKPPNMLSQQYTHGLEKTDRPVHRLSRRASKDYHELIKPQPGECCCRFCFPHGQNRPHGFAIFSNSTFCRFLWPHKVLPARATQVDVMTNVAKWRFRSLSPTRGQRVKQSATPPPSTIRGARNITVDV